MRCPYCSHEETQVVETRESDEGDVVRRRRRCQKWCCQKQMGWRSAKSSCNLLRRSIQFFKPTFHEADPDSLDGAAY